MRAQQERNAPLLDVGGLNNHSRETNIASESFKESGETSSFVDKILIWVDDYLSNAGKSTGHKKEFVDMNVECIKSNNQRAIWIINATQR
ncbi:MAG TPA: hypothetical protein VKZ53_12805 [Candidatus Angelobacter sp.]|nr:hypothetical protein [Candidatus Angelobacter sp.]